MDLSGEFDKLQSFVKSKPWVAVGVVGGVGALALFSMRNRGTTKPTKDDMDADKPATTKNPLSSMEPGYPSFIITAPPLSPANPPLQTVPNRSLVSLIRDGKVVDVTAGPPGMCPAGYTSAQQPGQPPRCTRLTDVGKGEGTRLSYFPGQGKGPKT